jgi:hypothetical protein
MNACHKNKRKMINYKKNYLLCQSCVNIENVSKCDIKIITCIVNMPENTNKCLHVLHSDVHPQYVIQLYFNRNVVQ